MVNNYIRKLEIESFGEDLVFELEEESLYKFWKFIFYIDFEYDDV